MNHMIVPRVERLTVGGAPLDGEVDIEHCPPGQPSAALRQAVADADRHARQLLPVPLYALRWCRVPRSMSCPVLRQNLIPLG